MIIRKERVADRVAVESLTRDAFWNVYRPGCIEHYILHILRDTKGFIPELSLVAVLEGEIVAHIAYTYVSVEYENGERDTYASFGPVSVLPDRQRKGIGQKLIDHSLVCARKDGHRAIFITGSSEYYSRFGFRPAHESGITLRGMNPNERADYFMVLELEEGALQGQRGFLDFDPLFDVKAEDVDKFDRAFPIRRKEAREGQL